MRWSKRTYRSYASLLHGLRYQNALSAPLQASYTLSVGKTTLSKTLQAYYTRCGGENALREHMKVCNTVCGSLKALFYTLFVGQNPFFELPTDFLVVKTHSLNSASMLHALWWSKRTLRTSASILHAFRRRKRTFYTHCGGQNALSNLCKHGTRFAVVKTHSPNFCKPPTHFVVKTYDPKLCKPPTRFAVVKTHSLNLCGG